MDSLIYYPPPLRLMASLCVNVFDRQSRVKTSKRQPRHWTVVELYDPESHALLYDTSTRDTGTATFRGIPSGRYLLGVIRESYNPNFQAVDVDGDLELDVFISRLRLSPVNPIRIEL